MVVHIKQNLVLNSDNVCYAKIVADEQKGFTNKIQISLVGGEKLEIEFTSVEKCKKCLEHIASGIQGSILHLDFGDEDMSKLSRKGVYMVK